MLFSKLFKTSNGFISSSPLTFALLILAITVVYFLYKKRQVRTPEKRWIQVGRVKKLLIYPLKSALGVEMMEALATPIGLRCPNKKYLRDRVFMIQGNNDKHEDAEKTPKMASISVNVRENSIVLTSPYTALIEIPIPENVPENHRECKFYTERLAEVLDCGDAVADWLDEFLGSSGHRLYYHHQETTQRAAQSPLQKRFRIPPSAKGTLQNDTAYQLLSQDSLDALNLQLENPVPFDSFRPNILVAETKAAFAEESWNIIRFGNEADGIHMKYQLPSARCTQINIDQNVGVMSPDREPLKTLYKLQRQITDNAFINKYCQGKPIMGIHLGMLPVEGDTQAERLIRVGDPIFALI